MKNDVLYAYIIGFIAMVCLLTYAITVSTELRKNLVEAQSELKLVKGYSESLEEAIRILNNEVQLREDVTSLIIDAGRSYNVHPMLLTKLIKSESNFRPNPNHAVPHWVGSGGINVKANPKTRNNPHSYVGGIYAVAERLDQEIKKHGELYNALIGYKGFNLQGREYADKVYKDYVDYLNNSVNSK